MAHLRTVLERNGDCFTPLNIYQCDGCDKELPEMHGFYDKEVRNIHFCLDCAFRLRLIGSLEYTNRSSLHAYVDRDGSIVLEHAHSNKKRKNPLKRRTLDKQKRFAVLHRDKFRCKYCGASPERGQLRVDHIKPVSNGGSDDESNLITSCFDCNSGKSDFVYKNIKGMING